MPQQAETPPSVTSPWFEHIPLTPKGTHFDVDMYIAGMDDNPFFPAMQSAHAQLRPNDPSFTELLSTEYKQLIQERVNPTVCRLRPTPDDLTIQYAVINARFDFPTLHVRFWYGPFGNTFGYSFDLINPETKDAISTPKGLAVKYFDHGQWHELVSFTEILRRCRDLPPDNGSPEKWHVNPGNLIRFSDGLEGPILGDVSVPRVPVKGNPHYECFPTHDEAIVNSFPLSL